MLQIVQYFCK